MHDAIRGKTWMFWAQLIICGLIGLNSVILGALFWTGAMVDARGNPRPQAGPYSVSAGIGLLAAAALGLSNIVHRTGPLIRCFRDGIECKLVGRSSLARAPLVPGLVRIAWLILSLQGFRAERFWIPWAEYSGARVSGVSGAYVLTLHGSARSLTSGEQTDCIAFRQVEFKDHPQQIADVLNDFAAEPSRRAELPLRTTFD